MDQSIAKKVLNHPDFKIMARKKSLLGWSFSILMFVIYVIYILYIGIRPEVFGIPLYEGTTTTWGICYGLFVILFSIAITGIYVYQANGPFEDVIQRVIREVNEENHQ